MDARQEYNEYIKYSINYLLKEDKRPLRFYKLVEILKSRIACSELQVRKALKELIEAGSVTINKDDMYLYKESPKPEEK